jgi:hypothetical protein
MQYTLDMTDGNPIPKRGDLVQTNVGNKRERTWFVIHSHPLKPTKGVPRCRLWLERWYEIEPDTRMKLFKSAERNGGQRYILTYRYPAPKHKGSKKHIRRQRALLID